MTKPVFTLTFVLLCSQMAEVESFQPSLMRKPLKPLTRPKPLQSSVPGDFFWDVNPVNKIDLDHAHECADHFGQCKIQELEDMKTALHTERVQHQAASGIIVIDPVEELDHRLLEEDLTVQLALLKGEMNDLLPYSFERKVLEEAAHPEAIDASYYHHRGSTFKGLVQQGEDMFFIPNGLADAAAFCVALFIIAFFPVLLR